MPYDFFRDELEPDEYQETRAETLEQMKEFQVLLQCESLCTPIRQ